LGLVRISVYSHWSVRLTYAVAKESGAPAGKYSTKTLDRANRGERLHIALV
jgi:ABC-type molybdate transport system substrate-binding protein